MNPKLRGTLEWLAFLAVVMLVWVLVPYPASP
jgi:hypothetical protein